MPVTDLGSHDGRGPWGDLSLGPKPTKLDLFRLEDYVEAFEAAGLVPATEDVGLTGRGLVLGLRR